MVQVIVGAQNYPGGAHSVSRNVGSQIENFIGRQPDVLYFEGDVAEFMRNLPEHYYAINQDCKQVSSDGQTIDEIYGALVRKGPGSFITAIAIKTDPTSFVAHPVTGRGHFIASGRSTLAKRIQMKAKQVADEVASHMRKATILLKEVIGPESGASWLLIVRVNTSLSKRNAEMEQRLRGSSETYGGLVADLDLYSELVKHL